MHLLMKNQKSENVDKTSPYYARSNRYTIAF